MAGTILAFGGKGGSGKTTLSALVLRQLIRCGHKPVLAVDADPNATLSLALGVTVEGTIADLRDDMYEAAQKPSEISKQRLMDQWLGQLLCEQEGFDLLTMGRPEGPKCYCYVNSLLRRYLSVLRSNYAYVIVDCEAGMEYLSRLTVDDVETLVLVAEPSAVGLTTATRISELADSLPIRVKRRVLAVNKVSGDAPSKLVEAISAVPNIDATVHVPFEAALAERWASGEAIDKGAGGSIEKAIEELTQYCLGLSPQATLSD